MLNMSNANAATDRGLLILNDAKSFPAGAGRYEVFFEGNRSGTLDTFEAACEEAATILRERASKVSIFDYARGYCIAAGRA